MSYTTIVPTLDVNNVVPTSMKTPSYDSDGNPYYYYGYYAFDTSKSVIGPSYNCSWISMAREQTNQRVNVNLGGLHIIRRVSYVNYHDSGSDINEGARYASIYGSNSNIMLDPYNRNDHLTELWSGEMERCTFNPSNPTATFPDLPVWNPVTKTIDITNSNQYKFYVVKILNNWEGNFGIGLRRIELQVEVG